MNNTIVEFVELVCPGDLERQQDLFHHIVRGDTSLEVSDLVDVLVGPEGQFCNACGFSVKAGSGKFVNRIPDFNDIEERIEMGRRFPAGDFVCDDCDRADSGSTEDDPAEIMDERR